RHLRGRWVRGGADGRGRPLRERRRRRCADRAARLQDAPAGGHPAAVPGDARLHAGRGGGARSRQALRLGVDDRRPLLRAGGGSEQEARRAGGSDAGARPADARASWRSAVKTPAHRTGRVAIVGRPNVGKSTLLNALVGVKLAAVTPKPQTTRTRIVGVRTLRGAQVIFVDTPGIHAARSALNRRMVDVAEQAIPEVDTICLVLDAEAGVTAADRGLIERLSTQRAPIIVALNKIDRVKKPALLPQLAAIGELLPDRTLVPLSALRGEGVPSLLEAVVRTLPEGPAQFGDDEFTTESSRFLVQEMVREQLFLALE